MVAEENSRVRDRNGNGHRDRGRDPSPCSG